MFIIVTIIITNDNNNNKNMIYRNVMKSYNECWCSMSAMNTHQQLSQLSIARKANIFKWRPPMGRSHSAIGTPLSRPSIRVQIEPNHGNFSISSEAKLLGCCPFRPHPFFGGAMLD